VGDASHCRWLSYLAVNKARSSGVGEGGGHVSTHQPLSGVSPQPLFNLSGVIQVQQRCGRMSERERAHPWPCALYAKDA
jgi:hypothetical protein